MEILSRNIDLVKKTSNFFQKVEVWSRKYIGFVEKVLPRDRCLAKKI
jgi:hypothetical protein